MNTIASQQPPHEMDESPLSRLELVWGARRLRRLQAATVVVFGAGGVGSNCLEALVRGGIGRLVVIDGDAVVPSNINRQAIAFPDTVGQRKVDAARRLITRINPSAEVVSFDRFVTADGLDDLMESIRGALDGAAASSGAQRDRPVVDYIVDAIDTVSAKLAIARWAGDHRVPLISSMGGANKLDPTKLAICDISKTSNDPLARVMRRECRKRGIPSLTVLSSTEAPLPLRSTAGEEASRPRALGTVSYLPPIMGQMIAGYVICQLAGEPHA